MKELPFLKETSIIEIYQKRRASALLQLISDKKQSLKEFTENNYAQGSFFWNYLLKNKDIRVNGVRVGANVSLQTGDIVAYYLTKKQEEKPAYYVAYQDENILVIDKESGVNAEAVFAALSRESAEKGEECYFIHRLDRNTKGLMIFAKKAYVEKSLLQAFKDRKVEKIYHALCLGAFTEKSKVLTAYLKKDADKSEVRIFDKPIKGAEEIITEYRVLETVGLDMTRVEVILHTGKTHQIRAHLAYIGCPIVGDMKYGDSTRNKALKASRQCLVAKRLHLDLTGSLKYLNDKEFVSRFAAEIPIENS